MTAFELSYPPGKADFFVFVRFLRIEPPNGHILYE